MDIRNELYYKVAQEGSFDTTHPSFKFIQKYGRSAKNILDIGCGEGTRLDLIKNNLAKKTGVDRSQVAIKIAKKQYPKIDFIKTKDNLPFKNNFFDFIFSAFVLEHTTNPEAFLSEAVRVLAPGGIILLVAPNFGAPNRNSPNGKYNRFQKIINGFEEDISLIFKNKINKLNWKKVKMQKTYTGIDADTTIEPYILTLDKYIVNKNIKRIKSSTLWDQETGFHLSQFIFKFLGKLNIYPFSYWGPHLLFIGKKYV